MYQRRYILNRGTAEMDLCWHWGDHSDIISLGPSATESGEENGVLSQKPTASYPSYP